MDFWIVATLNRVEKDGCKFFPMLNCAWTGQGGAERRNKDVKYVRTKKRNRQSHRVTEAYVWLKSFYTMKRSRQVTKVDEKQIFYMDQCRHRLELALEDADE